jgi:hypothetical protein
MLRIQEGLHRHDQLWETLVEFGLEVKPVRRSLGRRAELEERWGFDDCTEQFKPRPQRRCAARLPAVAPKRVDVMFAGMTRHALDERGFPNPCFTGDEKDASIPGVCNLKGRSKAGEFGSPPDERRACERRLWPRASLGLLG